MMSKLHFFLNESSFKYITKSDSQILEYCFKEFIGKISGDAIFHTKGDNYDWSEYLEYISDPYTRGLAYRLLTTQNQYPVEEDELVNFSAYTVINNVRNNDPYGYISAFLSKGFLFTVPVFDEFKSDFLIFYRSDIGSSNKVDSFYGENSYYALQVLEERRIASLSFLEFLKEQINAVWDKNFESAYNKLTLEQQKAIVDAFSEAKNSSFKAQKKGGPVKDVTTDKGKHKLYELKVFSPTAIRVYFALIDTEVKILSLGFKSKQSDDIKNAQSKLNNSLPV